MFSFVKTPLALVLGAAWVSACEFFRNQFLLAEEWTSHYAKLGLVFPAKPINGAVWGIWALVFAGVVWVVGRKFSLFATAAIAWVAGFLMMWLVIGNLGVLPAGILLWAVPLSMLEAVGLAWILDKSDPGKNKI